jgi:hypothetical protein
LNFVGLSRRLDAFKRKRKKKGKWETPAVRPIARAAILSRIDVCSSISRVKYERPFIKRKKEGDA